MQNFISTSESIKEFSSFGLCHFFPWCLNVSFFAIFSTFWSSSFCILEDKEKKNKQCQLEYWLGIRPKNATIPLQLDLGLLWNIILQNKCQVLHVRSWNINIHLKLFMSTSTAVNCLCLSLYWCGSINVGVLTTCNFCFDKIDSCQKKCSYRQRIYPMWVQVLTQKGLLSHIKPCLYIYKIV